MNKKGGYDFAIYGPFTLIIIVLLMMGFGIFFFIFGGANTPDITVKTYVIPESTIADIMDIKTSNGQTYYELIRESYSEFVKVRDTTCYRPYALMECYKKTNNPAFSNLHKEFSTIMESLGGQDVAWRLYAEEYPRHRPEGPSFTLAINKDFNQKIGALGYFPALKTSITMIPISDEKSLRVSLFYGTKKEIDPKYEKRIKDETIKNFAPQPDDSPLVNLGKFTAFRR